MSHEVVCNDCWKWDAGEALFWMQRERSTFVSAHLGRGGQLVCPPDYKPRPEHARDELSPKPHPNGDVHPVRSAQPHALSDRDARSHPHVCRLGHARRLPHHGNRPAPAQERHAACPEAKLRLCGATDSVRGRRRGRRDDGAEDLPRWDCD